MAMVFARLMHNVKIKRLEPSDPPCSNSFWLFKVTDPYKTGMVCPHREVAASQVVLKEPDGCYDDQKLLVRGTIMPLTHIECLGGEPYNTFDHLPAFLLSAIPMLLASVDMTNCLVGYASTDDCYQSLFEGQGGLLAVITQTSLASFLVKPVRGAATAAKLGM